MFFVQEEKLHRAPTAGPRFSSDMMTPCGRKQGNPHPRPWRTFGQVVTLTARGLNKVSGLFFVFCFCLFAFSRAAPAAYRGSQARGLIRDVAAGLCQSHSNARSESHLRPTPGRRQCWILNPLSEARDQTCILMDPSQVCYNEPLWELLKIRLLFP